eukprot:GHVL01026631.1.p1 GENE.GHVL01026631.1~~GHVL01026631.1.p1  ORF type:complete len:234 (+),score=34.44 GHVL01026631.1:34-702(+)
MRKYKDMIIFKKIEYFKPYIKMRNFATYYSPITELVNDMKDKPVYRGKDHYIPYTFKWGVGNKYKSDSTNQLLPVYLHRPLEVFVRPNYFESDNENIIYEELNDCWEVYWYENNKLNARPFPVKKFGVEASKREAWKYYETLKTEGRLGHAPYHHSDCEGVFWEEQIMSWVTSYVKDGKPKTLSYSATAHGYEGARKLAENKRILYLKELSAQIGENSLNII